MNDVQEMNLWRIHRQFHDNNLLNLLESNTNRKKFSIICET